MRDYNIRKAKIEDLCQIKELQEINHAKHLSEDEKLKNGFVSVETDISLLEQIMNETGIIVAEYENSVVGYELSLKVDKCLKIPLLIPFIKRLDNLTYKNKNLNDYKIIIAGQICIDNKHKGKGLAEHLNNKFIQMLKPNFDLLVTEVSNQNPRSLHVATEKLGFEIINEYSAEGRKWHIIAKEL